ncbi:hypothetical protein K488DRAFT_59547, partial [Vararia minispora EC-137]
NVSVNGEPWHSICFLEWDISERGATVELTLTDVDAVTCGAGDSAAPLHWQDHLRLNSSLR